MLKRIGDKRIPCLSQNCSESFSSAAIHLDHTCSIVVEVHNGAKQVCVDNVLFAWRAIGCMQYSVKSFIICSADVVQILLMLKVLFT